MDASLQITGEFLPWFWPVGLTVVLQYHDGEEEYVARCVPRLSFDVASLFGGEKRGCRYIDMTAALSLVLRANKLPLAFSA